MVTWNGFVEFGLVNVKSILLKKFSFPLVVHPGG